MSTRNTQARKTPAKAPAGAYTHTKARGKAQGTTVTAPAPQAPAQASAAPAAVLPFPDRRHATPRRRATDNMPVVDADTLQRAILRAVIQVVSPSQVDALMPAAPRPAQVQPAAPAAPPPRADSVTARLWGMYDAEGPELTVARAKELADAAKLNTHSAAIAFYNWRKARGLK